MLRLVIFLCLVAASKAGDIEREALGEAIKLGTLFDARKGLMYNGFELWSKETMENPDAFFEDDASGSQQDVFVEHNSDQRASKFGIGAELELEFMSGLIQVKGSAEYIKDDRESSNVARVVMSAETTTKELSVDVYGVRPDFDYCDMITESSGPTHVVVAVTYGQRAYLVFDKDASSKLELESVKGSLYAKIDLIPDLVIEGSVAIHVNGSTWENDDSIKVKFYGDAILESVPRTYNQAIDCYNNVVKASIAEANPGASSPIRYRLAPIDQFCNDITNTVNKDISHQLVTDAVAYLRNLKGQQLTVNTLLASEPSIRYTAIRSQLLVFKAALDEYYNNMAGNLAKLLPLIKSGSADESELNAILTDYLNSPFESGRAEAFLDQREIEVDTVEKIVANALTDEHITLSDIKDATDNECVFKAEYGTVFKLDILPSSDIAQRFVDSTGSWSEGDVWFRDDDEVHDIGKIKRTFEEYVDINVESAKSQCFLVKLDSLNNAKKFEVQLYYKGDQLTNTFEPPTDAPTRPICSTLRMDGFELSTSRSSNADVTGHVVTLSRPSEDGASYIETVQVTENAAKINVDSLAPHMLYSISTRYVVRNDHGVSAATETVQCTTRPFSPPSVLTVSESTENSMKISWARPTVVAHAFRNTELNYVVEVTGGGIRTVRATVTDLQYLATGLDDGVMYTVTVYAKIDGVTLASEDAVTRFSTAPAAPAAPTRGSVEDNRATFTIGVKDVSVPDGVTKDILVVKYYKMNGNQPVAGSEIVYLQRLLDGENAQLDIASLSRGTEYGVQVKLMVAVNNDKMISSVYSARTTIETTSTGSPISNLRGSLDQFKSNSESSMDDAQSRTDQLTDKLAETARSFSNGKSGSIGSVDTLEAAISQRFATIQETSNSFLKSTCAISGFDFYVSGSDSLGTESNVYSLQECLSKCADTDNCVSVSYEPNSNTCKKKARRMGQIMYAKTNVISANLFCAATQSASIDTWNDCRQDNTNFAGANLKSSGGISNIGECLAFCRVTDGCKGVTLNTATKTCYLKNKPAGDSTSGHSTAVSVSMTCMAATRGSIYRCSKANTIFAGSQIGSTTTIDTLKGCISYCSTVNNCESVSYYAASRSCRANSRRMGASQQSSSGWSSVNMYCLGLESAA